MKSAHITLATFVACLLTLPACGPQYQKAQPKAFNSATAHQTKNNISLNAKTLSVKESIAIFGYRGRHLASSEIIPVKIHIINDSLETVQFDPTQVNAPFAENEKVASVLSKSAGGSISGIIALGGLLTVFTGLGGVMAVGMYAFTGYTSYLFGLAPLVGVLITTSTTSVYQYKKIEGANAALARDINSMSHQISITPGQSLNTILFMDGTKFKGNFSISLNAPLSSTTFTIDLQK